MCLKTVYKATLGQGKPKQYKIIYQNIDLQIKNSRAQPSDSIDKSTITQHLTL